MHVFKNKEELSEAMVKEILSDLSVSVEEFGTANVLLSGGSTPAPVYTLLDRECTFTERINFGLIDERYVPVTSESSNEKYILSCFSKHSEAPINFKGMVFSDEGEIQNLQAARTEYKPFIDRTDIVILGMGADGHTASIFPNDPDSEVARKTQEKEIFSTKAPSEPFERITCSLEMILNAKTIYVLFFGAEKRNVLEDEKRALPIHDVLQRRKDVKLYYLDND